MLTPFAVIGQPGSMNHRETESSSTVLDNGRMENRRGVAHARLPEKTVQNCNAAVITGHRVELDKDKARLVGDRGQPSNKGNAILSGWHNVRACLG